MRSPNNGCMGGVNFLARGGAKEMHVANIDRFLSIASKRSIISMKVEYKLRTSNSCTWLNSLLETTRERLR